MTRWARGKNANKKKPLDASDWSEMKTETKGKSKIFTAPIPRQTVMDDHAAVDSARRKRKSPPESFLAPVCSLIEELQGQSEDKQTLKNNNLETKVLEEFVRKDRRRENRRLKRQEQKLQDKVCFNCRQSGHNLASCPRIVQDVEHGTGVCFKCGSTEHKIQQCRAKVPNGKFPFAKCFICGETGHLSKSCPDNPKGLYPNGGSCNQCGSVEHFKRDCPDLQKLKAVADTTLSTLDCHTNVEEDPSLSASDATSPIVKRKKVVKF